MAAGLALVPSAVSGQASVPAKPAGIYNSQFSKKGVFSWRHPGDPSITKYQYLRGAGSWTDIPDSDADTTYFEFSSTYISTMKIRAVNNVGAGPESDPLSFSHEPNGFGVTISTASVTEGDSGRKDVTVTIARGEHVTSDYDSIQTFTVNMALLASSTATDNTNVAAATSCTAPAPATADICYPNGNTVTVSGTTPSTLTRSVSLAILLMKPI